MADVCINSTGHDKTSTLDLASLESALLASWTAETSSLPEIWTKRSPAQGQCAVTALVVQDHLGGRLVRVDVLNKDSPSKSHYYNELPDGSLIDLTRRQFPKTATFGNPAYRDREYVLSYPETARRYEVLSIAVADAVKKQMGINIRKD